ncbi:MarR family winged helix-turn-helix transcriptional regulator [Luteipulveratus halotolerans]|uniref:MarR family transcriptional regulator n=1 Tax=Luteipulveratus halotolerans TaxID=1631356 RepID=A0A0L6CKR6_9MICO|nr:MarR family transcriptional regulator [Luteipulveratus halotolerans]KNX38391.1 MarR family transcriptional regulator [Luteipulveratus halotolerans]
MTAVNDDALLLENQVCYALALAARGVIGAYREVLTPLGLTHPQYLAMLALWQHEPQTNRSLSDALRLDPGTVTPLLRRLENLGYIRRARAQNDERTVEIHLTPEGRALRTRAEHIPSIMIRRLGLQDTDLHELNALLHRLVASAEHATDLTADELKALGSA